MMMMDLKRELPWLDAQEMARCEKYEEMSDEAMLQLLRTHAAGLDHVPAKHEIPDADYYRKRFGPWPRVLEKAGLKPPSPTKLRRQEANRQKRRDSRQRAAARKLKQTDE